MDTSEENRPYQLILVYCSSGFPHQELVEDLDRILLQNMTIVVTGDFNFDKKETNSVTTFLKTKMLKQHVDWPTHNQGRTIDHVYLSANRKIKLTRYSPYYSDHDALCIEFEDYS